MELKLVCVIVCVCALASVAAIPKCCVRTRRVPKFVLEKVVRWELQQSSGVCYTDALRLYTKKMKKPICADLALLEFLKLSEEKRNNPRNPSGKKQ